MSISGEAKAALVVAAVIVAAQIVAALWPW
jgi:hypothetical protein